MDPTRAPGLCERRRLDAVTAGTSRVRGKAQAASRRLPPDGWALIVVAVIIIAASLPALLDFVDVNPLGPRSGLISAFVPAHLGGTSTIDPNNGYASQALGHLAALDVLHLHLPWWNPYEGTGMPLAGETQSAALFPPTLLTAISNGQLYEHLLLELIAGLSTFLLLRRVGVVRWAAMAGGVAFGLNGTFAWFAHATVNPVAFLPMLLLGLETAVTAARMRRPGGWWLIAVAGALSVYAGFPEVAYINTLMGVAWLIGRFAALPRARWPAVVGKAAAGAVAGTLIAAPMLVLMSNSLRHADLGLHQGGLLGTDHLGPSALPQLFLPYVYGPIFGYDTPHLAVSGLWSVVGGYLTASLVLFAVLGLLSPGRRALRLTLTVWGLLVFSRMYGGPPGLGHILGLLPGMDNVAFFRYAASSLELTVIILAALGLDAVSRQRDRRRIAIAAATTAAITLAAGLGARSLTRELGTRFASRPYYSGSIIWALGLLLGAVLIAMLVNRPRLRAALLGGVLALDAVAMFALPEFSAPRLVTPDTAPASYLQAHLGTGRFFTLGPLQPNYGSYYGLASLNINDLPPKRLLGYISAHLDQVVDPHLFVGNLGGGRSWLVPSPEQELLKNLNGYRKAGVTYVLTPAGQALPQSPSSFTLAFRSPSTSIYRLGGAEGYFSADHGCRLTAAGRELVGLYCSHPATLVRRETDFPGWNAHLDGRAVTVRSYDGIFQAVSVPAGAHLVRFSFTPPGIGWGAAAFAAGWALLIGAGLHHRRRRPRPA